MLYTVYFIAVFIFSIICHEVAHGWAALRAGDDTAKNAGRLTLRPGSHIDPVGSILLPGLLILTGMHFVIGWAKPVPVDARNFRKYRSGMFWVSFAGIATNFLIAGIGVLIWRTLDLVLASFMGAVIYPFIFANIVLGVFNLLPIPPLDGSRLFGSLFGIPASFMQKIERFGFFILLYLFIYSFFFNARLLSNFFKLIFTLLSWLIGLDIELTT